MRENLSDLFVEFKNLIDENYRFNALENLSKFEGLVSSRVLSKNYDKNLYLSIPTHMSCYLDEFSEKGIVSKERNMYELSDAGKIIMEEIKKYPTIRKFKPSKKYKGQSTCTEEKIMVYLLEGPRTIGQICSKTEVSMRTRDRAISNLKKLNIVRKVTQYGCKFMRKKSLEDTYNINKSGVLVYSKLSYRKLTKSSEIIEKTSKNIYNSGIKSLLDAGAVSKVKNMTVIGLTDDGIDYAHSIKRMNQVINKTQKLIILR